MILGDACIALHYGTFLLASENLHDFEVGVPAGSSLKIGDVREEPKFPPLELAGLDS